MGGAFILYIWLGSTIQPGALKKCIW